MKAYTINMFADTAEDLPTISGMALTDLALKKDERTTPTEAEFQVGEEKEEGEE